MIKYILLLSMFTLSVHAQEVIPGLIPRFYSIEAATDLPIPPDVAHARALKGFDLSTLDPSSTTDIWDPNQRDIPSVQLAGINEKFTFVETLKSRDGQVRFSVTDSHNRELLVTLSKKAHNFLLRRNILAKLGYNTQPMSWIPKFQLQFADTIDRDSFKEDMKDKLFAGADRWVISEKDLMLVIQDALVMTPDVEIYNLASGLMSPEVHQGRRLLRAPYIPLALVDATESINLMSWQAGRIVLDNIKLNHTLDLDTGYGTSFEDARWIGRRMGKLTRGDFEEIVVKASFPESVEKLLLEKLISRRNDLMEILKLDTEFPKMTFDPNISFGTGVINGEIVQEFFDGYVTRFSYGDPESPFSASEMSSFFLSRIQTELLNAGVDALNKLLSTDDQNNYKNELEKIVMKEGPYFPTQAVVIPSFHGAVTLSRDIVTGTYLGTNNKVQLVDSFGYGVSIGMLAGIEGLPIPIAIKGGPSMTLQRVFSHVKPVTTLKKSLKEPFKNLLVPMLLKNIGKKIDKLTSVTKPDNALMMSVIGDLKNSLSVGESFIITDSVVPSIYTEAELSVSQLLGLPKPLLKVYAKIQAARMILTRFHLHRPTEDSFQIYQDYGKGLKLLMTMKLRSYVPVLAFTANWNKALLETQMYPISLSGRDINVDILKALRQSIFSLNHDALREVVKPHKVEDSIKGNSNTAQFLIFKRNQFGSSQTFKLTHAQGGEQKTIMRRYDAVTTGLDTESYAREAVNSLLKIILNTDLGLSDVVTINPGFTTGGKAKNKIFISEYDGSRVTTSYQRILNGWRVTHEKLNSLLLQINREVGRNIFDPIVVVNTKSILLYQITFIYTMTQEGNQRIIGASRETILKLLKQYRQVRSGEDVDLGQEATDYFNRLKKISQLRSGDVDESLEKLHGWLKGFQDEVSIRGLEDLAGTDNIAYQGRVEGFRQGDENGDSTIFSNVYGNLPLPLQTMPTDQVIRNWGILEGELTGSWMLERAI